VRGDVPEADAEHEREVLKGRPSPSGVLDGAGAPEVDRVYDAFVF
jgi:hypothetical protein